MTRETGASWKFRLSASHLIDGLGGSLYESAGACLAELIRNGVVACMPADEWVPGVGHVEITLMKGHHLNPRGTVLVVFDRGSGFTPEAIDRYCWIGPPKGARLRSDGAAQKSIGRWASYGLNRKNLEGGTDTGFYILTRTAERGPVTFVSMIPDDIERNQEVVPREIPANSPELGKYRAYVGSFTAIVICDPVFENADEIREGLKWYVPRKREQMFPLTVNERQFEPPPLESKITMMGDGVEVFIGDVSKDDAESGGIRLVDAVTGFVVAWLPKLLEHVPYPLWRREFTGDIFKRGLLSQQDTSRGKLKRRYLASADWRRTHLYLASQVAPRARALLGDDDVFKGSAIDRLVVDFAEACANAFGDPNPQSGPPDFPNPNPSGRPGGGGGGHRSGRNGKPPRERPRALPIKLGEHTFLLAKRPLDDRIFASVDSANGKVLYLNTGEYRAMPRTAEACREHVCMTILAAAGSSIYQNDPLAVAMFVGEHRGLLSRKRS